MCKVLSWVVWLCFVLIWPTAHAASLKVSLNDAEARAVIVDMARSAKINVLLSDRVQGKVTIEAKAQDRVGLLDPV